MLTLNTFGRRLIPTLKEKLPEEKVNARRFSSFSHRSDLRWRYLLLISVVLFGLCPFWINFFWLQDFLATSCVIFLFLASILCQDGFFLIPLLFRSRIGLVPGLLSSFLAVFPTSCYQQLSAFVKLSKNNSLSVLTCTKILTERSRNWACSHTGDVEFPAYWSEEPITSEFPISSLNYNTSLQINNCDFLRIWNKFSAKLEACTNRIFKRTKLLQRPKEIRMNSWKNIRNIPEQDGLAG